MKSIGEAMAIGRTFSESLQKCLRSLDIGLTGLNEVEIDKADDKQAIGSLISKNLPYRILFIAQAFRYGLGVDEIQSFSKFDPWFLKQIKHIVEMEEILKKDGLPADNSSLLEVKKWVFLTKDWMNLPIKHLEQQHKQEYSRILGQFSKE